MVDKDSGDFAAPVGNDQAYALSYTNSDITTAEGVLGPPLAAGGAYQVSFDVVKNGVTAGRAYTVRLIAFAADAPRNDCRSTPTGSTVLASATGSALDNGSFSHRHLYLQHIRHHESRQGSRHPRDRQRDQRHHRQHPLPHHPRARPPD